MVTVCGHEDGEIYDSECFYCGGCGELVSYETGGVLVWEKPEYEEYECPGRTCAKYLYGQVHEHWRVRLEED